MMHHSFQLAVALDTAGATKVADALRAVAGVNEIGVQAGADRIAVTFDAGRTSTMELATAVRRSGYEVREPKPHGAGSCCGGCGGH